MVLSLALLSAVEERGPERSFWRWAWVLPVVLGLIWCLQDGYQGLNGQDAHDYFRLAKVWLAWFAGGAAPAAAQHPPGYPFASALLALSGLDLLWAMRLIPLAAFAAVVLLVRKTLPDAGRSTASRLFIALMLGTSPFLLRHGLVVMSDLPALALIVAAWATAVAWFERRSVLLLVVILLCAMGALLVRSAAGPMLLGLLLGCALVTFKPGRIVVWAGILYGLVLLILASVWAQERTWMSYFEETPLAFWTPLNAFQQVLNGADGRLSYALPNILFVLKVFVHPGFLPVAVLLLPFWRLRDMHQPAQRIAACMVLVYLIFIAGMPFQNDRVLLLTQPFVAVLYQPAFVRAWAWLSQRTRRAQVLAGAVFLLQLGLFVRALHPFLSQAHLEQAIAERVNGSRIAVIYTHGMGAALNTYCPRLKVEELWYHPIERFKAGAWLVVRPEQLRTQWPGLNPGINWARAQEQGLAPVQVFPDGWEILSIEQPLPP